MNHERFYELIQNINDECYKKDYLINEERWILNEIEWLSQKDEIMNGR